MSIRVKDNQIRTGVIGVGNMGQHHARILAAMPESSLVGIADANLNRAQEVAARHHVPAYADYQELLAQVDAVIIAAPTRYHYEIGLSCLTQGLPVLIEKPLAASLGEAQKLAQVAEQGGLALQVGHIERFNPTFVELANVLAGHHIVAIDARRLSPFATRAADVSVVYDLMVHDLDLILTLMETPITSIQAVGCQIKSPQMDHTMAFLTFANGQVASLSASKVTQHKIRQITVTCTEAFVVADLLARTIMIYRQSAAGYLTQQNEVLYRQEGFIEQVYVPPVEPLHAELHHFITCVREQSKPQVGGEAALRVMSLAQSIETQALITLKPAPAEKLE